MSHDKNYKHRHGEPVSDACGDGRHEECDETFTTCHCTFRGLHVTPHAYVTTGRSKMPSTKRIRTPIPAEFDSVPEDIFPLVGGGFLCMRCLVETDEAWGAIVHEDYCPFKQTTKPRTHGEARAEFLRSREKQA